MNEKLTHMSCGGVGRYVRPHEIESWKGKGYVVTEEPAAPPKETAKAPKAPKPPKETSKAEVAAQTPAGQASGVDSDEGGPQ